MKLQVVCPQNETAAIKRLRAHLNEKRFLCHSAITYFILFDLHLIGRKVHHHAGVLTFDSNKTKKNDFVKKSFRTSRALRAINIRFGEFEQLDVACS